MKVVHSIEALRDQLRGQNRIAFVPTMGNLHAAHLALMKMAHQHGDPVVASIFVNPTQFGPNEDFSRYPRQEAEDLAMLETSGCGLAWLPGVEDIYPNGFETTVSVRGVSARWEGEARPGTRHWDGGRQRQRKDERRNGMDWTRRRYRLHRGSHDRSDRVVSNRWTRARSSVSRSIASATI